MSSDWTNYIDAAHRKVRIAEFHCEQLNRVLEKGQGPFSDCPEIPIQAYFEGVVVATVSAVDQVAQAANSALNLHLTAGNLFDGSFTSIESLVPESKKWREQPMGRDLRRLRVRMVHYSYTKSPDGQLTWQVETVGSNYGGSRDLSRYAEAAVAYARELGIIADKLAQEIRSTPETQRQI